MSRIDRRSFLTGAGFVPLIGTATAAAPYQPTQLAALKGSAKSVVIPTHEFAGNLDERLDFPADWEVNVMNMRGYGAPVLTPQQLATKMSKPVGAAPLREIAAGKKTVAITFDDLTRATPTYEIVPWVLEELKAAGIKDENILFIGSFATHRPMTHTEVEKKIGKEAANRYAWLNHACFYGCKELGTTSFGTKVAVNQHFLAADLKVTLSGIKVHYDAGYGGGAKAVLPGLSHIETIEYNHNVLLRQTKTAGPVRIFKNEMRRDMIEAARMAKVDFSVQLMYDQKLRPIDVRSGDIVDAHHDIVRVAARTYCTPSLKDADIVVSNAYPQNAQAFHAQRWINNTVRDGGTGVLIVQHPLTLDPIHFLNNRTAFRTGASYYEMTAKRLAAALPRNTGLIVYSQYLNRTFMNNYSHATHFASKWEDVIRILRERHKGASVRVAVYPYGGMQHPEIELDG